MPVSVSTVDPELPTPILRAADAELLSDNLARWASRLLGYLSLAGACAGLLAALF